LSIENTANLRSSQLYEKVVISFIDKPFFNTDNWESQFFGDFGLAKMLDIATIE